MTLLNEFLRWLFKAISEQVVYKKDETQALLWCPFPFFAKFLGDGVLFLWDIKNFDPMDIGNITTSLLEVCDSYQTHFLAEIRKRVSKPPKKLRCGIARGQVISLGEDSDFVGPCINVAARLQKLGQFTFAFPKRGFDLERNFHDDWKENFTLIKYQVRGVGEEELLYVLTREFSRLPAKIRKELSS